MRPLSLLEEPEEPDHADNDVSADVLLPAPAGWPAAPDRAVYHELPGEIVNTIAPHTESDPVAILTQLLVSFGAAVGRGAYFQVEATRHHGNEYMCLVGDSARARKGSSWDHVRRLITTIDPSLQPRILTGLSSGEGVIWAVRDPSGQAVTMRTVPNADWALGPHSRLVSGFNRSQSGKKLPLRGSAR